MYTLFPVPKQMTYGTKTTCLNYKSLTVYTNCPLHIHYVLKTLSIETLDVVTLGHTEGESFFIRFGSVLDAIQASSLPSKRIPFTSVPKPNRGCSMDAWLISN